MEFVRFYNIFYFLMMFFIHRSHLGDGHPIENGKWHKDMRFSLHCTS